MTSACSLVQVGRLRPAFDHDHSEHAGGHVVHEVAVESPLASCIDLDFGEHRGARGDADCVLEWVPLAVTVVEDGPHAVQVHRMGHHRLVDELEANAFAVLKADRLRFRSEEHTSELQSLMRISYAVFCLEKKQITNEDHILRILL